MWFGLMSACPPDYEGAAAFREAVSSPLRPDGSRSYSLKEIALAADVPQSLVTKWCRVGNVPESRIDMLPEDVRARYAELQGRRRGAYVLDRDLVQAVVAFVSSVGRPRPVKASLEPDSAGSLVPQRQRQEERSVA